jgi:hypothetical protein
LKGRGFSRAAKLWVEQRFQRCIKVSVLENWL